MDRSVSAEEVRSTLTTTGSNVDIGDSTSEPRLVELRIVSSLANCLRFTTVGALPFCPPSDAEGGFEGPDSSPRGGSNAESRELCPRRFTLADLDEDGLDLGEKRTCFPLVLAGLEISWYLWPFDSASTCRAQGCRAEVPRTLVSRMKLRPGTEEIASEAGQTHPNILRIDMTAPNSRNLQGGSNGTYTFW